jgi:uncharacterized cupredoxin-like copper-binding protein
MKRRASSTIVLLAITITVLVAAGCASNTRTTTTASATTVAAPVTTSQPPAASTVTVRLSEFAITSSATTVRAGKVTFRVTNVGAASHELVVLGTATMAGMLPMRHGEASEAGHLGEIGNLNPGQSGVLRLHLRAGHYAAICNFTGHYHVGMHTDFTAVAS